MFRDYTIKEIEQVDEDGDLTFRELLFQAKIRNKIYEVKITNSLTESEEIGEYIGTVLIIFMLFSIVVLLLLTRYISKFIWSPFYKKGAYYKFF